MKNLIKYGGVVIFGLGLYFMIFWGFAIAAYSSSLVLDRPEAIGATFWEFVIYLHLIVALIVWAAYGLSNNSGSYIIPPMPKRDDHEAL